MMEPNARGERFGLFHVPGLQFDISVDHQRLACCTRLLCARFRVSTDYLWGGGREVKGGTKGGIPVAADR